MNSRPCLAALLACGLLLSVTAVRALDWPQWRGPNRDGRVPVSGPALAQLPADLKAVWKIPVGGGFSSPVIAGGALVYMDDNGDQEVAHLVDAATGKEKWHTLIAPRYTDEWGSGTRSTPFIDGDRVYVQSCNGEFRCLNLADGKVRWGTSFEKDFGVTFLGSKAKEGTAARRGNNGSGLVDGPSVILPVGSTNGATVVCFDKLTGKVIWKVGNDEAAYSSLQVATLAGRKQVISFTADALLGADRETGALLWRVPLKTGAKRHACTPIIDGDTVTVTSQTIGLLRYKIEKQGNDFVPRLLWANKEQKINLSTPVLLDGFLYSQGPQKNFICVDAATGELKWAQPGFGKDYSSTLAIGKTLLVVTDDGQLVLVSPDAAKPQELARQQLCGKNWNFPAYVNGNLFVRDGREIACYGLTSATSLK